MKYRWDKKFLYWGLTAFIVIVCSVAFFFVLFKLDTVARIVRGVISILKPVIYGLVLAYLLMPIRNFFEEKWILLLMKLSRKKKEACIKKAARVLCVVSTVIVALCLVAGLFSLLLPQLIESITQLVQNVPSYLERAEHWLDELLRENPELDAKITDLLAQASSIFTNWMETELSPQLQQLIGSVANSVIGAATGLINWIIGFIISVYVLFSKDVFCAQGKKLLYACFKVKQVNTVLYSLRTTNQVISRFINGKLLDSLIIGILCFLVMSIFHWPYAVLISVIVGVTNVIPFFGPFIGAIPSAFLILLVDPVTCFWFVIFIIILQQLDGNIIGPKILGDSIGISAFWVLFALLLGGGLFGFVGMVISVPIFALFYMLVGFLVEQALQKKKLPQTTDDYLAADHLDEESGAVIGLSKPIVKPGQRKRFSLRRKKKEQ